jgi:alkylated DNA repair dioxygenase AlkB
MTSDPGYRYVPMFLNPLASSDLFDFLVSDMFVDWVQRDNVPRREYWMNDDGRSYTYGSGAGVRTYEAKSWIDQVRLVRDTLRVYTGVHFEGCFMNRYDGQKDALGWHADDDSGIDHTKPIAVVSLGWPRALHVRSNDKVWHEAFMLEPGSLLLMPSGSQFTHQHKIPKADRPIGARVSLTFRSLK